MTDAPAPSYRPLTAFFIPLALQSASQSLTYPLVAMVASHGPGGTLNLAGVAQSNIVMFLVGAVGAGLVTAGMVYGKSRLGFSRFFAVNNLMAVIAALVQAAICIPAVGHGVFGALLGLPPSIEGPARQAFPLTILLNVLFFARNPYEVLLLNNGAFRARERGHLRPHRAHSRARAALRPGRPGWSALGRRLPIHPGGRRGGRRLVLQSAVRVGVSSSRRQRAQAPRDRLVQPAALAGRVSHDPVGDAVGRCHRKIKPARAACCPLTIWLSAWPTPWPTQPRACKTSCFASLRDSRTDRLTRRFALRAGTIVSFVPLVFLLPALSHWYYVSLQRLAPADLSLVTVSALLLVGYPFTSGLRAHWEGIGGGWRVGPRPSWPATSPSSQRWPSPHQLAWR